MIKRIGFDLLLTFSAFALPWWISVLFLIFFIFCFSWYYEGIMVALGYELLYRLPGQSFFGSIFWITLGVSVAIFVVEWLKQRLYVFR